MSALNASRPARLGFALAAALAALSTAAAAGECWTALRGQYFDSLAYCVSSVLAPQGANRYGPKNLSKWDHEADGAWCAGGSNDGVGETIVVNIVGGPTFRRLLVMNGYGKSAESFFANNRVRTVEIASDSGLPRLVRFPDRMDSVPIVLPRPAHDRLSLRILSVYRGDRFHDTCLSLLMPDFEDADQTPQ